MFTNLGGQPRHFLTCNGATLLAVFKGLVKSTIYYTLINVLLDATFSVHWRALACNAWIDTTGVYNKIYAK